MLGAGLKRGTCTLKKSKALKSDIWKSFSLVYDAEGNQLAFACCDKCQKVLAYTGHKSGTSGLNRHVCTLLKGQQLLDFRRNKAKVSEALKEKTVEKCVDFVAADLRPYDSIAGRGLVQLAQHLVDTAASIGKFDVQDILPHPTTVSRHVEERALKFRRAVAEDIKVTIEKYGCAITTDVWTETYRKTSFLSATLHYINSDYKLQSRVLFSAPFDEGTSKTGENISVIPEFKSLWNRLFILGGKNCVCDRQGREYGGLLTWIQKAKLQCPCTEFSSLACPVPYCDEPSP